MRYLTNAGIAGSRKTASQFTRMLRDWAVVCPGREPVEIITGDVFRIEFRSIEGAVLKDWLGIDAV